MTLLQTPPRTCESISGRSVERALLATDYHRAAGRIDVVEHGVTVRSCRFVHVPDRAELRVYCSIDNILYLGSGRHGLIKRADGRRFAAPAPTAHRDIPNWLLCPSLAPIWGRAGEDWSADTSGSLVVDGRIVTVPLHGSADRVGHIEIVWPGAYLRRLALADEHYVLHELDWQPSADPHARR